MNISKVWKVDINWSQPFQFIVHWSLKCDEVCSHGRASWRTTCNWRQTEKMCHFRRVQPTGCPVSDSVPVKRLSGWNKFGGPSHRERHRTVIVHQNESGLKWCHVTPGSKSLERDPRFLCKTVQVDFKSFGKNNISITCFFFFFFSFLVRLAYGSASSALDCSAITSSAFWLIQQEKETWALMLWV